MRLSLTDTAHGRSQAADQVTLTKLANTVANASCDIGNGVASALGDAAHGGADSAAFAWQGSSHAVADAFDCAAGSFA